MAVVACASASGSPGVTTTVLALGIDWPRPVVIVEADPTAGSAILAGYFHAQVEPSGGLVGLMVALRDERLAARLPSALVPVPGTAVQVLPGIQARANAAGLAALWLPLLDALRDLEDTGTDVLVDVGRIAPVGSPEPLVYGADALLLVTGSNLPSAMKTRALAAEVTERRPAGVGLLVVGPDRPYEAGEVAEAVGLPVVGRVAWDSRAASVFSDGEQPPRHLERSAFQRSIRATGEAIRDFADAGRRPTPTALSIGGVS